MSRVLHRAILDALRDAQDYREKGILVSPLLEATVDLAAHESVLYQAVYTLFRALPSRLLPGSLLLVSTQDVEGGVELLWEGREPFSPEPEGRDVLNLLRSGPHGDLLEIAMLALERFCEARAGYVEQRVEPGSTSSAFERAPYVVRRVAAYLPALSGAGRASSSVARPEPSAPRAALRDEPVGRRARLHPRRRPAVSHFRHA